MLQVTAKQKGRKPMQRLAIVTLMAIFLGTTTMPAIAQSTVEGELGEVQDLRARNLEELKKIKETIDSTNSSVETLANDNMSGAISRFNNSLRQATAEVKAAVGEYEREFTPAAQSRMLERLSGIYGGLLDNFEQIDLGFLRQAQDVYGNAITKGARIANANLEASVEGSQYKRKLISAKVKSLAELQAKLKAGTANQANRNDAQRIARDIGRLEKLIERDKKNALFWNKIGEKFAQIEDRKALQLQSLETSILAFNQLRDEIDGQKQAVDQMIILGQLDELTTQEFEQSVDTMGDVGDDLFAATDAAFENVFADLLSDEPVDDGTADDAGHSAALEADIDAILQRYQ